MSQEGCSFQKLLKVNDNVCNLGDLYNFNQATGSLSVVSHLPMPNIKLYVIIFMCTILSSLLLRADLPGEGHLFWNCIFIGSRLQEIVKLR